MTVFPEKYKSLASTTRPALGAAIGAPVGLGKSAPLWGLRAWPLKMLRAPKWLATVLGTGGTNGPLHSRSADESRHSCSSSAASRTIRASISVGGLTSEGSTFNDRTGKRRDSTLSGYVARSGRAPELASTAAA